MLRPIGGLRPEGSEFMEEKHFAICITRTCGSGGTEIGKMLADQLHISLYDRKLLQLASDDSGINERLFAAADMDTRKTLLYRVSRAVYSGQTIPPESGNFTSDRNLFEYQAKVLHGLLEKESFVVLGRAADYVLADTGRAVGIYLSAGEDACLKREKERLQSGTFEANRRIRELNRYRSDYYRYHTGRKWKDPDNYDLCLRTDRLGYQGTVDVICDYIKTRFF